MRLRASTSGRPVSRHHAGGTLATLVLGAAVGIYLARHAFIGKRMLLSLLTLPLSFPGVIIGFFVILLGWAAFAPLDAAVNAPGVIAVSGNRQSVQHRDGGVVTASPAEAGIFSLFGGGKKKSKKS